MRAGHLGEQALVELQKLWQEGVKPIPRDASDEENYEMQTDKNLQWGEKVCSVRIESWT